MTEHTKRPAGTIACATFAMGRMTFAQIKRMPGRLHPAGELDAWKHPDLSRREAQQRKSSDGRGKIAAIAN